MSLVTVMKSFLRAGWAFVLLTLLLATPQPAGAQGTFEVSDVQVVYNFGEQITFQARIQSPAVISQASILFRAETEPVTRVEPLTLAPDGSVSFQYNATQNLLPPFSRVIFWFQVMLANGETATSPVYNFRYADNRFEWRQSTQGSVSVHWYRGDDAFGQAALDAANAGLENISQWIPVNLDAPLDIYIYADPAALQGTLYLGGSDWMGGQANPELGVAMVAVAPGLSQGLEMDAEIPHELAHVMLYRSVGEGYSRIPTWLNEGLASLAERYPNPDYQTTLDHAVEKDAVLPFTDLCDTFPSDAGRAYLAYAQSESFVRYLRETYSATGLSALVKAYADGMDCELGATRALGMPLSQLDARWREAELGQNAVGAALRDLAPYLLVLGMALAIPLWGVAKMLRERRQDEPGQ
jgi:hypothetical protein